MPSALVKVVDYMCLKKRWCCHLDCSIFMYLVSKLRLFFHNQESLSITQFILVLIYGIFNCKNCDFWHSLDLWSDAPPTQLNIFQNPFGEYLVLLYSTEK